MGDIVHMSWSPKSGNEMGGDHYGVVLSVEKFNKLIPRVVVAPITSKDHPEFGGLRIPVQTDNNSIHGFICMDHIRTIDPVERNLQPQNDTLMPQVVQSIKFCLRKIFGILKDG